LAKGELAKYITNCGGQMVINTQTDDAAQMYKECKCKKYWHAEVATVEDVVCTSRGSTFTLKIDGKQYPNVTTTLLGQHNISNILVGVTVARILGLSAEEIIAGIENLAPTTHRLALVPSKGGLIIIDDAYNGSVEGAKAAIDVLKNFDGQKVIITPGLVELGKEQFVSNFELGKLCATVCDYCIIDSAVNKEALFAGLEFGKFDTSKILFADNLSSAVNLLNGITKPGDVVLFENDLPDNYK
jgi:UDP-N-acetylmuramoyl-tripeptide--D-alanyl-D-alanine ligase